MTRDMAQPGAQHCGKCGYQPGRGGQRCPECGHAGHGAPLLSSGRGRRRFALGTALLIAAVALMPLLAAAVAALLRL